MKKQSTGEIVAEIAAENGCVGGILILQKPDDAGQLIGQSGLNHQQVRDCLCIATYYNEKMEMDKIVYREAIERTKSPKRP